MSEACEFCGRDPYEYVNNGIGLEAVAVTCCELGCAVYDHRNDDAAEITITPKELREIASNIARQRRQIERRDRLIGRLWNLRRPASPQREGDRPASPNDGRERETKTSGEA